MARLPRRAVAVVFAIASAALAFNQFRTVSAQALPPAVMTDKTGYLAGETVSISGTGFMADEVVTLQVTHADGGAESSGNHNLFTAIASASGAISATWTLGAGPSEDLAGNDFVLTASRVPSGALPPVAFGRVAVVRTNKYDYQPGEAVRIDGDGFRPGESVTVQVVHTNGQNDGNGHTPFYVTAGPDGHITTSWRVDPDDSEGTLLRVLASGTQSGLSAVTLFTDAFLTFADDQGPDDEPGQKDLSYLQFEEFNPNPNYAVRWAWDDTGFSGNNSGDGCVLFDNNNNGFADRAICVSIKNSPATFDALHVYSCGLDSKSDRCAGQAPVTVNGTTAVAAVTAGVDPFQGLAGHTTGNTCSVTTGCYTDDTVADVSITIADAGGASAKLINVCSYPSGRSNSDPSDCIFVPGSGFLRIVKVVQDVTTLFPAQFTFNASAPSRNGTTQWVSPSFTANGTQTVVSQVSYVPGNTLDLSEVVPTNWTLSSASCVLSSGSSTGTSTGNSVNNLTIQEGLITTCTFTNTEDLEQTHARLTLVKTVTNDNGGTADKSAFTLSADGPTDFSGAGDSQAIVNQLVLPGNYTVSETTLPGYTASAWGGDCAADGSITLAAGDNKTCSITNDDNAPALHLRKVVTNDNGGTATVADFTLTADGTGTNDLSGTSPVDSGAGLLADTFALSETLSAAATGKYTASAWVCVGGTQNGSNITLGLGESATCTITNNDNAPALHLRKVVTNDNGGTATVADFTLTADGTGTNDLSGTSPVDSGAGLLADTFALSETLSAAATGKYTASAWVCVGGTQNGSNITLGLGESATCTITNDDIAPRLTLSKAVLNNNGGTATPVNFTLTANGGAAGTLEGPGPNVTSTATFQAGTYSLSETGPSGYSSAQGYVCQKNGGASTPSTSIELSVGDSAACRILNDDLPGTLIVKKVVINDQGGTNIATDFAFSVNGGAAIGFLQDGGNTLAGINSLTVNAGTYNVTEGAYYGYATSYSGCANVQIVNGGSATCTITNDDTGGTIVVIKNAKPAQGSFGFTTTGTDYDGFTLLGDPANNGNQNSQNGLAAGDYTVTEGTQLGWILTGIGGGAPVNPDDPFNTRFYCTVNTGATSVGIGDLSTQAASITLKNGDTVTCTFENTGEGVTRTQGFWATHTPLANIAWFGGTAFGHTFPGVVNTPGIGDTSFCGVKLVTDLPRLMGGFWSDISKTQGPPSKKRSALDQARMQLLQQLLAAELNASAFGSVPAGGSGQFAVWEAAYCGSNPSSALQGAASFNNSGDSATFTPGTSADSKNARAIANKAFWDNTVTP